VCVEELEELDVVLIKVTTWRVATMVDPYVLSSSGRSEYLNVDAWYPRDIHVQFPTAFPLNLQPNVDGVA
jgi:hypothetical protein